MTIKGHSVNTLKEHVERISILGVERVVKEAVEEEAVEVEEVEEVEVVEVEAVAAAAGPDADTNGVAAAVAELPTAVLLGNDNAAEGSTVVEVAEAPTLLESGSSGKIKRLVFSNRS